MIRYLNSLKLGQKLHLLFLLCVLIPMLITDGIIIKNVQEANKINMGLDTEKTAYTTQYCLSNFLEYPVNVANNIYRSSVLENFFNETYPTSADYYTAFYRLHRDQIFDDNLGISGSRIYIYADNKTILNGSGYYRMERAKENEWYPAFEDSEKTSTLYFYYGRNNMGSGSFKRKLTLIMKMDMPSFSGCEKLLAIDLDYSAMARELIDLDLNSDIYICDGDKILLSNRPDYRVQDNYDTLELSSKNVYTYPITLYDRDYTLYVIPRLQSTWQYISGRSGLLMMFVLINLILPLLMMRLIEGSITSRILSLERSFESVEDDELKTIDKVEGNDEITGLIKSYNRMVERMNELMHTVYKDRLQQQENDIARQNAELLALHSQINPHFLFNALESIRMHSLIKKENETAEMVGKLAIMERSYVSWGDDLIPVHREMDFVKAYLLLQKYRFGDRLNYELEIEDDCVDIEIPKLTIVTFVENACLHGVERKAANGWIFVRAYREGDSLALEVEDTGEGMNEELQNAINKQLEEVSLENMKGKKHVGMMNACMRLKLLTKGRARYRLESEEGVGTVMHITIPIDK